MRARGRHRERWRLRCRHGLALASAVTWLAGLSSIAMASASAQSATMSIVTNFEGGADVGIPATVVGTEFDVSGGAISATGGTSPFDWSIASGSLPPGISMVQYQTNIVTLEGTSTTSGTYDFTLQVTDSSSPPLTATRDLSITVFPSSDVTGVPPVASFGAHFYGSMGGKPMAAAVVSIAPSPDGGGYLELGADGGLFTFGDARYFGSVPRAGGLPAGARAVGIAETPDGGGYWICDSSGGVYAFGDAGNFGSVSAQGGLVGGASAVGCAATPDGKGYWVATSTGDVYAFGDAQNYGSMAGTSLAAAIVAIVSNPTPPVTLAVHDAGPDGNGTFYTNDLHPSGATPGYWLVASDGGIFTFGGASFYGSMGGQNLAAPIVSMAPSPDGGGYWEVASDGGIFSFGDAAYFGSMGGIALNQPVVGIAENLDATRPWQNSYLADQYSSWGQGNGYWLVASDGGIFAFPDPSLPGEGGEPSINENPEPWSDAGAGNNAPPWPYTFEQTFPNGSPVRWDPCRAITWTVNVSQGPSDALSVTQQAVADVAQATGFDFVFEGTTDYSGPPEKAPTPPGSISGNPDNLIILWQNTGSGLGGVTSAPAPQSPPTENGWLWPLTYLFTQIQIGDPLIDGSYLEPASGIIDIVLHELGHAMGLFHTDYPGQAMEPEGEAAAAGGVSSYGAGDLAGLAAIGSSLGCLPAPSPFPAPPSQGGEG